MQKLFSQEIRFRDERGEEYLEWDREKLVTLRDIFVSGGTRSTGQLENGNVCR